MDQADKISPSWLLARIDEVKLIRKGNHVTVIVPKDVKFWEVGILIDEKLRLAGLTPEAS